MFLAQLNLSKQHTPSWAVKRADRETTEGEKNGQLRVSVLKNSSRSEKGKKRGSEGRRELIW